MEKIDYDTRLHAVYAAGRGMSGEALDAWTAAFARSLPAARPVSWLDLGSGTGRLSPALAEAFGGPVYGVEPSARMREQAPAREGVEYLAGAAESIPLPDAAVDAALVFSVWHHVADPVAGARELHRVVRPGGRLFVQVNLADAMPDVWWLRVVPAWLAADRAQFRTEGEVLADFTGAGWTVAGRERVTWLRSPSLAQDLERLRLRAVSVFEHLDAEAVADGFARIEAALPTLDEGPRYETSELLVLERP